VFTWTCHLSLSWARWIRSTRFLARFLKCILICFHLCQDPESCLFLQVFPKKHTHIHVFFWSTPAKWKPCVLLVGVPILRFALFWDFTQPIWVVCYRRFTWLFSKGPIGCPETSVTSYQSTLRKILEEGRLHLYCGENLKSRVPTLFLKLNQFVLIVITDFITLLAAAGV
jgi:hypothetical protein